MLQYTLYLNEMTKDDPDDCMARAVDLKVNNMDDLIKVICGPGSILKPTEVKAVIENYWANIANFIREGEGYSDESIKVKIDMSGVYTNKDDRYDPSRHSINVGIIPGKRLQQATKDIKVKYVDADIVGPKIESVYDWGSDSTNEKLTPGDTLEIIGSDLKIYDNTGEQGVFFINQENGIEIPSKRYRTNEPKKLSLRVPDLPPGNYRIEVRNTTRMGKAQRIGIFVSQLKVG